MELQPLTPDFSLLCTRRTVTHRYMRNGAQEALMVGERQEMTNAEWADYVLCRLKDNATMFRGA